MIGEEAAARRPLPVVLKPVPDELLSSWLARHAAYYGVSERFFAKWLMLGANNFQALDHRLGFAQVARLSEKLHCDPIALIAMTFIELPARSAELVCRGRTPQICRTCADRHAREGASGAVPKHWRLAWRITCPTCGAPFSDMIERPHSNETLRDTSPFYRLWPEALAGEAIIERFLHGDDTFEYSPIALIERALRHAVIARRISFGTRTDEGSRFYAAGLSIIDTCRRRGVEPWAYACSLIAAARANLTLPIIPAN